jgi:hypothetical protein
MLSGEIILLECYDKSVILFLVWAERDANRGSLRWGDGYAYLAYFHFLSLFDLIRSLCQLKRLILIKPAV